jgi:hypothetical protein
MPDDDFFALPPFNPDSALASLRRTLREMKLVEREGVYELKGQPIARAQVDGAVLKLGVVRRFTGLPEWTQVEAKDHAVVRRFTDELRRRLLKWDDSRGDE